VIRRTVAGLTSIALIGRGFRLGFRYLLTVVIARGLGASSLGAFTFAFVLLEVGALVTRLGLGNAAQKYIPRYRRADDADRVAGTVITGLLGPLIAGTLLVGLLVVGLTMLPEPIVPVDTVTRPLLFGIPLLAAVRVAEAATRGFDETKYGVYVRDIGQSGAAFVFVTLAVVAVGTLRATVAGYLLSLVVGLTLALYYLRSLGAFEWHDRPRVDGWELASYGGSVVGVAVLSYLVLWTDVLMLGSLATTTAVGYYQAAFQTASLLVIVLTAANAIFPPRASALIDQDRDRGLATLYTGITKWVTGFTILGFLFLAVNAELVADVFGPGFQAASRPLIVLAVGHLALALTGPGNIILLMGGYERVDLAALTVAVLLNTVLNYVLISAYGPLGAAIATTATLVLLNATRLAAVLVLFGIHPFDRSYWRLGIPLLASLPLVATAHLLPTGSIIAAFLTGTAALVAFVVVTVALGFDDLDRQLLQQIED